MPPGRCVPVDHIEQRHGRDGVEEVLADTVMSAKTASTTGSAPANAVLSTDPDTSARSFAALPSVSRALPTGRSISVRTYPRPRSTRS